MKLLKLGCKGPATKELQEKLTPKYYRGKLDGDFGPMTQAAVRVFQTDFFVNGEVDEGTAKALDSVEKELKSELSVVPIPSDREQLVRVFGKIDFVNLDGGRIRITNNWAKRNVVKAHLPIVGYRWVHKKLVEHFAAALRYIEAEGFAGEITQFGTWAPRHILHNSKKPLSLHSWGIACDINWHENHYGDESNLHPVIIEGFKKFGFTWGGDWRKKDPMHFQYYK